MELLSRDRTICGGLFAAQRVRKPLPHKPNTVVIRRAGYGALGRLDRVRGVRFLRLTCRAADGPAQPEMTQSRPPRRAGPRRGVGKRSPNKRPNTPLSPASLPGFGKRQGTSGRICSCGAVGVQPPLSGIPRPTIPSSRTALRAETKTVAVTATAFVSLEFANSPITSRLGSVRSVVGIEGGVVSGC